MAPGLLPAGKPPGRATQPPEPATPSANAHFQERKRKTKVAPSPDPPEKKKTTKKKKKEKAGAPPAETEKKHLPLPVEHAWTPGDELKILEADPPLRATQPPVPTKSNRAPSAKSKESDAQLPERSKRKIAPSADPPGKKVKTISPPAEPEKNPLPSKHAWTPGDEVKILEALAAHRRDHSKLPRSKALFVSLQGRGLDNQGFGPVDLRHKVHSLKYRHDHDAINVVPANEHECSLYRLSKMVWGTMPEPVATSANAPKMFDEMYQLYPYLTHEVIHIVDDPAVLERLLEGIDDTTARVLNSKIENIREELTEAIMESAKMQSIEVPKIWQCPSTKLQPGKSRTEKESILERLDKIHGAGVGTQEQLARIESQLVELKQNFKASRPSPKAIRCDSAASAPHSVVAEKHISGDVLQRNIPAQKKLIHCKNREVTSKFRPRPSLWQKPILPPKGMPRARKEKMDAESQILHDVDKRKVAACAQEGFLHDLNVEGGKEVILLSVVRPHRRVAKGTLQTSSISTIVGGKALGPGCCLVLVNEVFDGKAPLIRPFGAMNTMVDALGHSIAWTRQHIRHDTTAGTVVPDQASPGQKG